ncbi:MAG: tail fiber domain-containing protein, partial [Candidatus Wallbacteria bacterium]|nr:tail fiber domain-containing protein [Candidatus Wallbacteria bacterium]
KNSGKIGVGTSNPEFKLTIDKGAASPDGGIMAIGTYGSGTSLETSGVGTRMFWYPKKAAFRAGYVSGIEWDDSNIGDYSTAFGNSAKASGVDSTAIGYHTTASGLGSTAMGVATTASGYVSTAIGDETIASGECSIAMGSSTTASGWGSTAMGEYTVASGQKSTAMGCFTVASGAVSTAIGDATTASANYSTAMGNSTTASGWGSTAMGVGTIASGNESTALGWFTTASGSGSSAMGGFIEVGGSYSFGIGLDYPGAGNTYEITQNNTMAIMGGKVGIGTVSPTFPLQINGGIMDTGTFGEGDTLAVSGAGTRMFWYPKKAAFRAGKVDADQWDDLSIGDYSTAFGWDTKASNSASTAFGYFAVAGGAASTAFGNATYASGDASTAFGNCTHASGHQSTAFGFCSTASGFYTTAFGYYSVASGDYSTAFGNKIEAKGNYSVGIGLDSTSRTIEAANTMAIMGGKVGIGTVSPTASLEVNGSLKATLFTGDGSGLTNIITTNADKLDSQEGTYYLNRTNHTGTQSCSTISGFTSEVQATITAGTGLAKVGGTLEVSPSGIDHGSLGGLTHDDHAQYSLLAGRSGGQILYGGTAASNSLTLDSTSNTTKGFVLLNPNGGNVGIGAVSPEFRLTLDKSASSPDGGIMAIGTYGSGASIETSGLGTRMFWYPKKAAFRAGHVNGTQWDDFNIGQYSEAFGYSTTARGSCSTAMGVGTIASGEASTAMGNTTIASNIGSTAMGMDTLSSGEASTAMGANTIASNNYSTAMGVRTLASGNSSTALGGYSTASATYSTAMGWFPVASGDVSTAIGGFTVASGPYSIAMGTSTTASGSNSTAMGVYTTASGANCTAMGTRIKAGGNYSFGIGLNDPGAGNTYEITQANTMAIMGGKVGIGKVDPARTFFVNGDAGGTLDWYNDSDERLKKNIRTIDNALDKVLSLRGVNFEWKDPETHVSGPQMGLIAQEAEKVVPEVVSQKNGTYAMQYSPLVGLLIEAMKDQQKIIDEQGEALKKLSQEMADLKNSLSGK